MEIEENNEMPVVEPTPEMETTATPLPEVTPPEDTVKPSKVFTQEELDAQIGKRLALEKRKWERSQTAQKESHAEQLLPELPSDVVEQIKDPVELQKFINNRAEEIINAREASKRSQEIAENYADREAAAIEKYDDFEQVAYNNKVPIDELMAKVIRESDSGPDIAYYLGLNIPEAVRISQMSPVKQALELGKIEAKLASQPLGKKTSNAPAPVNPVKPKGGDNNAYDTTDPRSTGTMSTSEWIEAERQRQIRKMKAGQ